jgi:hypothetical protein
MFAERLRFIIVRRPKPKPIRDLLAASSARMTVLKGSIGDQAPYAPARGLIKLAQSSPERAAQGHR